MSLQAAPARPPESTSTTRQPCLRSVTKKVIICDVNVLIAAYRRDALTHAVGFAMLARLIGGSEPYGWTTQTLSAVVRITVNPRIWPVASTGDDVLLFCADVMSPANARQVEPGARHWPLFEQCLRSTNLHPDDVGDAVLAALCIEHGCELVTWDKGFSRFKGLRVLTPEQALAR